MTGPCMQCGGAGDVWGHTGGDELARASAACGKRSAARVSGRSGASTFVV
jgi:hypothetical protein